MKALTDKIVDFMIAYKDEHHNVIVKSSVENLIEQVKKIESEAEFEEAARVLMKHLANGEKYHPHMTAIVESTKAEVLEGVYVVSTTYEYTSA